MGEGLGPSRGGALFLGGPALEGSVFLHEWVVTEATQGRGPFRNVAISFPVSLSCCGAATGSPAEAACAKAGQSDFQLPKGELDKLLSFIKYPASGLSL
jgi:hypothetical protein